MTSNFTHSDEARTKNRNTISDLKAKFGNAFDELLCSFPMIRRYKCFSISTYEYHIALVLEDPVVLIGMPFKVDSTFLTATNNKHLSIPIIVPLYN